MKGPPGSLGLWTVCLISTPPFLMTELRSDLRGHPLGKVREVLASESLWRLSLNGNPAPGRRTIRTFPSRSSPSAGTFHLRQTSTCSGVVWFWIMLRSIWKDWLVPVAAPLVAALIGWRIDSTSGQGFAMVVSVVPKQIMAAVAGLMAFGLLKGAEWVGPILVSRLLGPQFRFVVRAIESRVKGRCTCRSAINLQNEFRMEARRAESR